MINVKMHSINTEPSIVTMKNVYEDDAKWINENDVSIEMECLSGIYVVYGECNDNKHIVTDNGRTCEETIKDLVQRMKYDSSRI